MNLSPDGQQLLSFLQQGNKLTAMVAPSFPVDFKKNGLIGGLKKLGFDKVCDHSVAIAEVNKLYEELFEKEKGGIVIAANCPTSVNLIKTRFPDLVKYLPNIPAPIGVNGRLCKKLWPENLNIFIGPCIAKKNEAKSFPEVTLALTYKELKDIFAEKNINTDDFLNSDFAFDGPGQKGVEIFPASGGMKATLDIQHLGCRKIIVGDEIKNLIAMFSKLQTNQETGCLFYDILACPGGCIGGPGVVSAEVINARKQKLLDYTTEEGKKPLCSQVDTNGQS
ncbi:MAG: hypothetical protein M1524_00765 [Patescibacteria group bacterium]|nr:hypothetical protein [Patescibacteria group bacterium]